MDVACPMAAVSAWWRSTRRTCPWRIRGVRPDGRVVSFSRREEQSCCDWGCGRRADRVRPPERTRRRGIGLATDRSGVSGCRSACSPGEDWSRPSWRSGQPPAELPARFHARWPARPRYTTSLRSRSRLRVASSLSDPPPESFFHWQGSYNGRKSKNFSRLMHDSPDSDNDRHLARARIGSLRIFAQGALPLWENRYPGAPSDVLRRGAGEI